jgi:2-oxoglutarate ferredoxin oxidoreductase subunit alpha
VGRPSENALNRKLMMEKRLKKLNRLSIRDAIRVDAPNEKPDLLIIGMGSTGGTIDAARDMLKENGIASNHVTVRQIHPFPTEELKPHLDSAKKVIVIENNATAQLAGQIKMNAGYADKIESLLKYDGNPFLPLEVYKACKELS